MFSSSNPFPHLTSSPHGPDSLFSHERDSLYSHPFLSGDSSFHAHNNLAPPAPENISPAPVGARKKDRHSKIYTAQGPRDRRVRLSMEIARKFFALQDLLGFDKASKTLDWLLTKSNTAIEDLLQGMKHMPSSSSTATDLSEVVFMESFKDNLKKKKKKTAGVKKMKQNCKSGFLVNLEREQLRAEARARARERTKEKLRIKKLDDESKKVFDYCHLSPSNLVFQSSCWSDQIDDDSQNNYKDPKSSKLFASKDSSSLINNTHLPKYTESQDYEQPDDYHLMI